MSTSRLGAGVSSAANAATRDSEKTAATKAERTRWRTFSIGSILAGLEARANESHGSANQTMDGTKRSNVKPGARVKVVQKQDQGSGKLTEGVVRDILTSSPTHPHGIKVRLTSGIVGRVKEILAET